MQSLAAGRPVRAGDSRCLASGFSQLANRSHRSRPRATFALVLYPDNDALQIYLAVANPPKIGTLESPYSFNREVDPHVPLRFSPSWCRHIFILPTERGLAALAFMRRPRHNAVQIRTTASGCHRLCEHSGHACLGNGPRLGPSSRCASWPIERRSGLPNGRKLAMLHPRPRLPSEIEAG